MGTPIERQLMGPRTIPTVLASMILLTVILLTASVGATAADEPVPPNLCTMRLEPHAAAEWYGHYTVEWRVLNAAGEVLAYGQVGKKYGNRQERMNLAARRAHRAMTRNHECVVFQHPDWPMPGLRPYPWEED